MTKSFKQLLRQENDFQDTQWKISKNPNKIAIHNSLGIIFLGYHGEEYADAAKALYHCERSFELAKHLHTQETLIEALILNDQYSKAKKLNNDLKNEYGLISRFELFSEIISNKKGQEANKTNSADAKNRAAD